MKRVKNRGKKLIHALAQCNNCNFEECLLLENLSSMKKLRYLAKKHVKDTGHSVSIEMGYSEKYFIEKE